MGWLFACNRTRRLHSGTTPTRSVLHQLALYFTNSLCTSPTRSVLHQRALYFTNAAELDGGAGFTRAIDGLV